MAEYNSAHTGPEIDAAVSAVKAKQSTWDNKQDKITGKAGQVVGFDASGNPIAQEAPSGGASSWNDLKDKPVVFEPSDTLTWDGNTEGLVCVNDQLYKVSDNIPSKSDLGEILVGFGDLGQETTSVDNALIVTDDGCVFDAYFAVIPSDNYTVSVFGEDVQFLEKGIYFLKNTSGHLKYITIPGYTGFVTEKLDPAYLPDCDTEPTEGSKKPVTSGGLHTKFAEVEASTNELYNVLSCGLYASQAGALTWDGVIGDKTHVPVGDMVYFVHVSDEVPSVREEMPTAQVGCSEMMEETSFVTVGTQVQIENVDQNGLYMVGEMAVIVPSDNYDGGFATFPKKGVYFMAINYLPLGFDVSLQYVSTLRITGYSFASEADKYFENATETKVVELGDTLTWDGVSGINALPAPTVLAVRVADCTLTYEQLKAAQRVSAKDNNGQYVSISVTKFSEGISLVTSGKFGVLFVHQDGSMYGDFPMDEGIYFANIGGGFFSYLKIDGHNFTNTVKTSETVIKTEHLPKHLRFGMSFGEVMPETEFTGQSTVDGMYFAEGTISGLSGGEELVVSFDGVEYNCSPIESSGGQWVYGNGEMFGLQPADYPFMLVVVPAGGACAFYWSGVETHTISIWCATSVPIDTKYIPNIPPEKVFNSLTFYVGMDRNDVFVYKDLSLTEKLSTDELPLGGPITLYNTSGANIRMQVLSLGPASLVTSGAEGWALEVCLHGETKYFYTAEYTGS